MQKNLALLNQIKAEIKQPDLPSDQLANEVLGTDSVVPGVQAVQRFFSARRHPGGTESIVPSEGEAIGGLNTDQEGLCANFSQSKLKNKSLNSNKNL
ncbi:hypothetical protein IHE30_13290 [Mycetohabitans sp. B46]